MQRRRGAADAVDAAGRRDVEIPGVEEAAVVRRDRDAARIRTHVDGAEDVEARERLQDRLDTGRRIHGDDASGLCVGHEDRSGRIDRDALGTFEQVRSGGRRREDLDCARLRIHVQDLRLGIVRDQQVALV